MSEEEVTAEESTPVPDTEPQVEEETKSGNREAAKYRTKLREVEAELETSRGRLVAQQQAHVELMAGRMLDKPEVLWTTGVEVDALLDDDGMIDQGKLVEAITGTAGSLGIPLRATTLITAENPPTQKPYAPTRATQGAATGESHPWDAAFVPNPDVYDLPAERA